MILEGRTVRLEPLEPARHGVELFDAAQGADADPALWDYLFVGPFADRPAFDAWLANCARSTDPHFLTVVDQATGHACGMVSFMRITPAHGVIEIGNIWFGSAIQRRTPATEAIWLLAHHALAELGYRRLEWKCDAANARSRRAALRFGFSFEGIFRQHMVVKGRNRDTAWFAIPDTDWRQLGLAFQRWLDPANFDADGHERRGLATIRAELGRGEPFPAAPVPASTGSDRIAIRPLCAADRAAWDRLYADYATFYRVEQSPAMRERVWGWLMDPAHGSEGLAACDAAGRLVGIAHFRPYARVLAAATGGFLDDLFVLPDARGSGVAQALIEAVAAIGRQRGWSLVRWITAEDNYRARRVYDQLASRTPWLTYQIDLV